MADFFSRLVERTIGRAPVIQPLTPSGFAPGPAIAAEVPPDSKRDGGVEGAGEGTQVLSERETKADATPPASPHPLSVSEGPLPSVMPNPLQRKTPDTGPPLVHHVESRLREAGKTSPLLGPTPVLEMRETESPSAHRVEPGAEQEAHGSASLALQKARTSAPSQHSVKSGPREPVEVSLSQRMVGLETPDNLASIPRLVRSEDSPAGNRSKGDFPTALEPLFKEEHGPKPLLEPSSEIPNNASESQGASKASHAEQPQALETRSDDTSSQKPSAPKVIRPNVVVRREPAKLIPGEHESALTEPLPSPPAIRVTIGRVEVRAIVPPTSPKPRTTPARRAPALSLDDYIKQRNEGQR